MRLGSAAEPQELLGQLRGALGRGDALHAHLRRGVSASGQPRPPAAAAADGGAAATAEAAQRRQHPSGQARASGRASGVPCKLSTNLERPRCV